MVAKEVLEAARGGDLQFLKSFSEIGRVRDQYGATCLHYAARSDHVEVLEYLVKQRNFDSITRSNVGATPVHDAAAAGNLESVKWFLNNTPCKVDDQDGSGATVVHLAARYGHTELVEWLMDNTNCDILKKAGSGAIPLHFAVLSGDLSCVKLLLSEAPRSVNAQLNNGVTPSYLACQEGQLEVLKHLVFQAGSNLKMNAFDAMSCVHAASQLGHLECVKFLVKDQKMNPNERDFDGATPLHFAASRGHPDIVDWLIKHGGARVTLDNLGGSPLHNAVEMGQVECVKTLLENGCDKEITDNQGLTAVELGEKCHQHQCVAVLKGEKLPEPTLPQPPVKSEPPSVPKTTVAADSFVIPPLKSPSSNQLPSTNRAALYRPVSVISTTSSNSEFGLSEPQAAGKQHQVAVEVHCDSRETGEKERVNIASINHSNPSASNHTRSHPSPVKETNSNQRNSFHSNKSPPAMEQYVTPARPDIATEILRSGGSSSLRKSKPPTTGGEMNCVFSFGGKNSKAEDNENKEKPGSLTGEFDPKNFLKDVPEVDSSGVQIPDWRRQVLAKNLAQKAQADALEKQKG